MPSRNDTLIQTLPANDVQNSGHLNYNNYYASRANKRQSPSTVSAEAFLKSSIGENTLVVGHSNTIPGFVNNLIDEEYYNQIDDLNNSNLYIVSICDSGITHKLITVD